MYQIEFMNSLYRKCWERSGIFEAVQMVWRDERQFITGCTEVTVSPLISHSFIKYLLCAQLCQALFQAKGIQLWRSQKNKKQVFPSWASDMDGRKNIQTEEKAGPKVGPCLVCPGISQLVRVMGVPWARTVGGYGVRSCYRGWEGGESYLCHYSILGFYSKLEKHQVLSRRVTWSDLSFKRILRAPAPWCL